MNNQESDRDLLDVDKKFKPDGGTCIVGYLMIAVMLIVASLVFWFGTKWLVG